MQGTKIGKGCCRFFALVVLFSAVLSSGVFAEPLDNWHVRDPLPQVGTLNGVVYGNNIFVAVEGGGVILTSFNGSLWDGKAHFDFTHCLVGVAYGDSTFVAVGAGIPDGNPVGIIFTSSDGGMSWLNRPSGVNTWLIGVTCGDSTFVAVGGHGTILTSTDKGATWKPSSSGITDYISGVAYGNNTFVAVETDGMILASSDGKLWRSSASGTNNSLEGVAYGNNTFVAVGEAGTVLTSSDGVDWGSENSGTNTWLIGITYGNGTFVAVGDEGTILTSADGGTWESRISGISGTLYAVTYGNNAFVAVGDNGLILQSAPVVFPIISVSPTILNFDSVNVGSPSSKKVTITNTGSANLVIGAVKIIDTTSGSINFKCDTRYARTIAPTKSSGINVTFSPKSKGVKTASLLISSNDPYNSTVAVLLNGYGLNGLPQINSLVASPSSGKAPLNVKFTAKASDSDGRIVGYWWDFDGNGVYDSYGTTNSKTVVVRNTYRYSKAGTYNPEIKVVDNEGAAAYESVRIKVK